MTKTKQIRMQDKCKDDDDDEEVKSTMVKITNMLLTITLVISN